MRTFGWIAVLGLVAALALGCEGQKTDNAAPAAKGGSGVGVVDLDRVANELKINDKYKEYLNKAAESGRAYLQEELKPMQATLTELEAKAKEVLDSIPEAERTPDKLRTNKKWEEAARPVVEQRQRIQQTINAVEQRLREYNTTMQENFKNSLQAPLKAVASQKGFQLVVPKGAGLYVDPQVDMTNELISYLQGNPLPPLPEPSLSWK